MTGKKSFQNRDDIFPQPDPAAHSTGWIYNGK